MIWFRLQIGWDQQFLHINIKMDLKEIFYLKMFQVWNKKILDHAKVVLNH